MAKAKKLTISDTPVMVDYAIYDSKGVNINETLSEHETLISNNATSISQKQDKLTAGSNITISNNVISASLSGGGGLTGLTYKGNATSLKSFYSIVGGVEGVYLLIPNGTLIDYISSNFDYGINVNIHCNYPYISMYGYHNTSLTTYDPKLDKSNYLLRATPLVVRFWKESGYFILSDGYYYVRSDSTSSFTYPQVNGCIVYKVG